MRWKRWIGAVALVALLWFAVPRWPLVGLLFHHHHKVLIYGKVVDQHGDPVPKAEITVYYSDSFFGDGKHFKQMADAKGLFTVEGFRGNSVGVHARKRGYEQYSGDPSGTDPASIGKVYYGERTNGMNPREDPADPMVLTLFKFAPGAELYRQKDRLLDLAKNGGSGSVLLGGGVNSDRRHAIGVSYSNSGTPLGSDGGKGFHWNVRFHIPDGGLAERIGEHEYKAPEEGYESSLEFSYPGNLTGGEMQMFNRSYFVHFADGTYAIWNVSVSKLGRLRWSSSLNPDAGSRNLSPWREGRN